MYPTIASIMTPKPRKAAEPSAPSYEQETIDFFAATSTPDNETVSIYGITNHECYELFDSVVKYWKTEGVYSDIIKWHPMFGGDAVKHGYNAIDVDSFYKTFSGSWIIDANGNKGNKSNTYAVDNFVPNTEITSIENMGFTLACNSNEDENDNTIELGSRSSDAFMFIALKRNTDQFAMYLGDINSTTSDTEGDSAGVSSAIRESGVIKLIKNASVVSTGTASGSLLPNDEIYYGAYNEFNRRFSNKRLLSEVWHNTGNTVKVSAIQKGIDMWEQGLGRATWTKFFE